MRIAIVVVGLALAACGTPKPSAVDQAAATCRAVLNNPASPPYDVEVCRQWIAAHMSLMAAPRASSGPSAYDIYAAQQRERAEQQRHMDAMTAMENQRMAIERSNRSLAPPRYCGSVVNVAGLPC